MENIGTRIKNVRKILNLSQAELACQLGITKQAISNIENSKCAPNVALLGKLLIDYNVNLNYIIAEKGSMFVSDDNNLKSLKESLMEEVEQLLSARGLT